MVVLREDLLEEEIRNFKQLLKWQEKQFLLITQDLHERIDELKIDNNYLRADIEKLKGALSELKKVH